MDYTVKVGGEAGQGIQTIGDTLARVFSRSGLHAFSHQDYESRVRGGHNFYQIRLSDSPVNSPRTSVDLLIALDTESISRHGGEMSAHSVALYDSAFLKQKFDRPGFLDIPLLRLAEEKGTNKITANTVATGAALGVLGMEIDGLIETLKETFGKKGGAAVESNLSAARAGYEYAIENCQTCGFVVREAVASKIPPKMLIGGAEAIALGALASGVKFYSAYPMTPSTGIMNYLAGKAAEYGVVVEQAEDEICAVNMALGASFAGVRAMTGTAGGGFALMVEGLSLAGMTETPVVIALGQRPAPATGLPTRTEQADLQFALYTAHGEFPRIVFAPGTPEEAFYLTAKAFDLSEKYQVPAIVLFDQHLADSQWTYGGWDTEKIKYKDYRLRGGDFSLLTEYKRHAFTDTGVSPMAVPGDAGHVVVTDSDEHDEEGHIVEDAETRIKMVEKRLLKKLPHLRREISAPEIYGDPAPDVVLVSWGSTFGVVKEAVDAIKSKRKTAMVHFSEIYPFPEDGEYLAVLRNANTTICVENNATGQFARLMRAETGFEFKKHIGKFDGRPFTLEELIKRIHAEI